MLRTMLKSKIHRATVTRADLHYVGSITIDEDLMDAANLLAGELVSIADIDNGNRLETYVITGERDSGVIAMNGAAAHLINESEQIIIMGFELTNEPIIPNVVLVDRHNKLDRYLSETPLTILTQES